ncbi:transcriptional regulator, RpiR family [Carnobacterium iners]|uniref:Transcriptional regulator, RpiR family n=1 Tax=Carnobacterium iners TaxID=1073423 RepID=A0A1X7N4R5_9LACT|nr:MurR/RpiR family transcriptional regulator [Carnobacterium iners]SEL31010.1 transcriptional regulator, RpiR family [Carnobacterium iners]SMH32404.1 transcriptional regulator, RpiR family [Carnobacterium iners]
MITNLNLSNRISQNFTFLTKKDKHIATYILENQKDADSWNIKDLAHLTNTSNATITRFCHKLNYHSFSEFKTLISQELHQTPEPAQLTEKITDYYNQLIYSSSQLINPLQIAELIQAIQKASKIVVFGLGSSGLSAMELGNRLTRMGLVIDAVKDPHMMIMSATLLNEGDLLIAISNSGETDAIVQACETAKKENATIFAITNRNHTSLTEIATAVLFASDNRTIVDERFINSQLPIYFILDMLCYVLLENESYLANRKKTLLALELH